MIGVIYNKKRNMLAIRSDLIMPKRKIGWNEYDEIMKKPIGVRVALYGSAELVRTVLEMEELHEGLILTEYCEG